MMNRGTQIHEHDGLTNFHYADGRGHTIAKGGLCVCCRKAPAATDVQIGTYDRQPQMADVCDPCAKLFR